ncbi:MAG: hypothetical protein V2A54_01905, partial [Bacteroidota bacterium]
MKKILFITLFIASAMFAKAQTECQANFNLNMDSASSTLFLYDNSYNTDSTIINVTSWAWTVQYGG